MTTSKIRLWTAASLTLIPTLILVLARFAWGDRLPETVASHWSGSTPDGFSTTTTFFAIALVISLVAVVCACVVAARSSDNAPLFLAVTSISSATLATIWILSVALTIDAGSPEAARIGWWILAPIAAVLVGVLAYALPDQQRSGPESPLPTPTLDTPLTASERAVWVGQVRSVWPWIATAGLVVLVIATAAYSDWWVAVILGVSTLAVTAFASVTVRVDRHGVGISSWGVRWKKIPISKVKSASVDAIRPAEWGGWGYRMTPRGTAVTLRSGEAIVVTLESGRLFAVTVDHPGRRCEADQFVGSGWLIHEQHGSGIAGEVETGNAEYPTHCAVAVARHQRVHSAQRLVEAVAGHDPPAQQKHCGHGHDQAVSGKYRRRRDCGQPSSGDHRDRRQVGQHRHQFGGSGSNRQKYNTSRGTGRAEHPLSPNMGSIGLTGCASLLEIESKAPRETTRYRESTAQRGRRGVSSSGATTGVPARAVVQTTTPTTK